MIAGLHKDMPTIYKNVILSSLSYITFDCSVGGDFLG